MSGRQEKLKRRVERLVALGTSMGFPDAQIVDLVRRFEAGRQNTGRAGQTAKAAESKGDDAPLAPMVSALEMS